MKLCKMEHQGGHDAIWRGVCRDLERIFQGAKFFLYCSNTITSF